MHLGSHISKEHFFYILDRRLLDYHDAITSTSGPSLLMHMRTTAVYHIDNLRRLDNEYNLFNTSFWGYGVNSVCDGVVKKENPDVMQIKQIGGLNKHHEPYRVLYLLTFTVEKDHLLVSSFSIDTCKVPLSADLHVKYSLKDFIDARVKTTNGSYFVEFSFKNVTLPVSFQVETYHPGGNHLSGSALANYYIQGIKKYAEQVAHKNQASSVAIGFDFLTDFVEGIKELQTSGVNEQCIKAHLEDGKKDEALFRNYFKRWFTARKYTVDAEPERRTGRIDLKVCHKSIADKVIEFKGWWNKDKNEMVKQVCGYLTEFEGDGYLFMINNTKRDILNKYKKLVTSLEMNYIDGSWEEVSFQPTAYKYFKSQHNISGNTKWVYHFIFPVHL
jgi:hypothetical protein